MSALIAAGVDELVLEAVAAGVQGAAGRVVVGESGRPDQRIVSDDWSPSRLRIQGRWVDTTPTVRTELEELRTAASRGHLVRLPMRS
jgi:hypothetical protein